MRRAQFLLTCSILLYGGFAAEGQESKTPKPVEQTNVAAIEREIREYLDSYADDLRRERREAIADRYDPRGAFFLGHGRKVLESFEAVKKRYQTAWTGPKSFEWKDISVEVLSSDAALVVCRFDWGSDAGETVTASYTGLLLKRSGKWLIRVEDESIQLPKPPAK